jgi:hypothetical protein
MQICVGKYEEKEFQLIVVEFGIFFSKFLRKVSLKFRILLTNISRKRKVNFVKTFVKKRKQKISSQLLTLCVTKQSELPEYLKICAFREIALFTFVKCLYNFSLM